MANKFEKKEWEDRQAQYPSRRKLLPTGQENIYDVERAEGDVTVPGNAFDAQNMNDLEDRIYDAFSKLEAADISVLDKANVFTKSNVEDVLLELFMYASNGKKAFANAIGGSASSTFQVLANLAGSIKQDRDSGKQLIANAIGGSASSTFQVLANLAGSIKQDRDSGKQLIANAIGGSASSTFQVLANLAGSIKQDRDTIKEDRDSGKILISSAIGGSAKPTMTFKQLSDLIISRGSGHYFYGITGKRIALAYAGKENYVTISASFGFVPDVVIVTNAIFSWYYPGSLNDNGKGQIVISNKSTQSVPGSYNFEFGIRKVTKDGFQIFSKNKLTSGDSYISIQTQLTSEIYAFKE